MAAPANYSAESMLPSPAQAVELKVFQGGGGMPDGAQPQVSLYEQPGKPVDMVVYKGGGGGKPLTKKDILALKFRGIDLNTILTTDEYGFLTLNNILVFQVGSKVQAPYKVTIGAKGEVQVVPIKVEGETIQVAEKGISLTDKYFYADDTLTSEATKEQWKKSSKTPAFFLPFSTLLKPSDVSFLKTGKATEATTNTNTNANTTSESEETNSQKPTNTGPILHLGNNLHARLVTPGLVQMDIENLIFTPSEQYIFEDILHFDTPFIRQYLKKHPKEWLDFWKVFIHNNLAREGMNGTSAFFYLSGKDAQTVKSFFQTVQDAHTQYLIQTAKQILFKTQAYGAQELYEMQEERRKKGYDTSLFIPAEGEEKKEEEQSDERKQLEELENVWESIQTMFRIAETKVDTYKMNKDSLKNVVDTILEKKNELIERKKLAEDIDADSSIIRDYEEKLKQVNRQYLEQLKRRNEAIRIYKDAYDRFQIGIEDIYSIYFDYFPLYFKNKKGIATEVEKKEFAQKDEIDEDDLKTFQKQLEIHVKTIERLEKATLESEEKTPAVANRRIPRTGKRDIDNDELEDDIEYYENENEELEETFMDENTPKRSPPKRNTRTGEVRLKKKQVLQNKKQKEVDNILSAAIVLFLKKDPKRTILAKGPGIQNTRFLFFFLLWNKLTKYIGYEETDVEIDLENNLITLGKELKYEGPGKSLDVKIKTEEDFIQYIETNDKRSVFEKTTEAILLVTYTEGLFNLNKNEINKIISMLFEKFETVELRQGEESIPFEKDGTDSNLKTYFEL